MFKQTYIDSRKREEARNGVGTFPFPANCRSGERRIGFPSGVRGGRAPVENDFGVHEKLERLSL